MTSPGTQKQDKGFKYTLYEQLGVREYWLFDPKGEWIEGQLRGYRLRGNEYEAIADSRSELLGLQLRVEGELIGFYREDTGEKLLIPGELAQALKQETAARQQAERRAEQAEQIITELMDQLEKLGIDPDEKI